MDQIRKYRQRMFAASKVLGEVIPPLIKAIENQTSEEMISRQLLLEVRDKVEKLIETQDKIEAHSREAGAATGHLLEYDLEMAELTTFSQYPEVAAQSSPNFIASILSIVEISVLEEALTKQSDDKLLLIGAATQRIIAKRNR